MSVTTMLRSLFSRLLQCLLRINSWIYNTEPHCRDVCSLFSDLWSHYLQQDIIDNILGRLGALDRIRFSAVCTCWRAAVGRSTSTSAYDFPFVLHTASSTLPNDRHSILSLDDNRYYYLNRFFTNRVNLVGTIEGRWLIMSHRFDIWFSNSNSSCGSRRKIIIHFISNPVTGKEFVLPPLSDNNRHLFREMVASSEPTTTNCMVAGAGSGAGSSLAFCRLTDSNWTFLNLEDVFKGFEIYDITFFDGKLYVSGDNVSNFIIVFDLRHENKNGVYKAHKIVMAAPWSISYRSGELLRQKGSLHSFYLSFTSLASDLISGELLLIICDAKLLSKKKFDRKNYRKAETVQVISFRVYKMNIANYQNQWIRVTNLGGRILFYGNHGSFLMPSKVFGESIHQDNCIYYAFKINNNCADVGKFCLNDQTIIRYPTKRRNACAWFVPTTN